LLNQELRALRGAERESVAKTKRAKLKKKLAETMLPNLSSVPFKDALKALLKTPMTHKKKSHGKHNSQRDSNAQQ
jgi:hypothetical protein